MKHFEELWCDAENVEDDNDISSILLEIKTKTSLLNNDLPSNIKEEIFGEILYSLSKLSKVQKINVYSALRKAIVKRLLHNS